MTKRKRYSDKYRATALALLEASGYPEKAGGLVRTAKHLKIPESTLRGWWNGNRNPPPAELRVEKRIDLVQAIRGELVEVFNAMPNVRADATYKDLATATGIFVDKLQILQNKPTAIVKLQAALQEGRITPDQVRERWPSLAERLFAEARVNAHSND